MKRAAEDVPEGAQQAGKRPSKNPDMILPVCEDWCSLLPLVNWFPHQAAGGVDEEDEEDGVASSSSEDKSYHASSGGDEASSDDEEEKKEKKEEEDPAVAATPELAPEPVSTGDGNGGAAAAAGDDASSGSSNNSDDETHQVIGTDDADVRIDPESPIVGAVQIIWHIRTHDFEIPQRSPAKMVWPRLWALIGKRPKANGTSDKNAWRVQALPDHPLVGVTVIWRDPAWLCDQAFCTPQEPIVDLT